MARIRYIKPEFFSDTTVAEMSTLARLFYIGLFCQLDCRGVTEDNVKLLKREIFPYDDAITSDTVLQLLEELIRSGRLVRFEHEGKNYLYCRRFSQHQKFHHKEFPKYKIPDEILEATFQPPAGPGPTVVEPPSDRIGIGMGIRIGMGIGIGTENGELERGKERADEPVDPKILALNEELMRRRKSLTAFEWGKP